MEPIDLPAQQPGAPATEAVSSRSRPNSTGLQRAVLTAGMAAALLIAGGVAVVSAASPDPSASPSATTATEQSTDGTTSSGTEDTARPDCPLEDGNDGTTSATPTS